MTPAKLDRMLEARPAYGGLDLSATTDITAYVHLFPIGELYHVRPYFWIPGDGIRERSQRDRVPYQRWIDEGWIETTPGNAVDYRYITRKIIEHLAPKFDIREIAFDRWGAQQVYQELMDAGLKVVQIGQGYASMSAPTKELQNLVLTERLRHYGNPVLRWMADCMSVSQDPAGNIKPVKVERHKSSRRIDGIVALIMALACAMANTGRVPSYSVEWI